MRGRASRRRNGTQQAIDPHAHDQARFERFNMNVGRAQFDRALEQIIDRSHNRGAAGKIAQALDIIVGARQRRAVGIRGARLIVQPGSKHRGDVLK